MMHPRPDRSMRMARKSAAPPVQRDWLPLLLMAGIGVVAFLLLKPPAPAAGTAVTTSRGINLPWTQASSVTVSTDRPIFSPGSNSAQSNIIAVYTVPEPAKVKVTVVDDAGRIVRTLLRDKEQVTGQYSVTWDGRDEGGGQVADGQYRIQVNVQGPDHAAYNNVAVTVDTKPPVIRLANVPNDMTVKDADFVIQGVTDPSATVYVNNDPQPVTMDGSGGFSVKLRLKEGENRLEITALDEAGNTASITRKITLLTKPPDIVITNPPDGLWINQKLLSIQGQGMANTTLRINGRDVHIDSNGKFTAETLLQEGSNLIRIEAKDPVGNISAVERTVYLKTKPPSLTLSNLDDGMVVRDTLLRFSGQTEPNTTMIINGKEIVVDRRGEFYATVNLVAGENLVKLDVQDKAGNIATVRRQVKYDPQGASLPPAPPVGVSRGIDPAGATPAGGSPDVWSKIVFNLGDIPITLPWVFLGAGALAALWLYQTGRLSPSTLRLSADRGAFAPLQPGGNDSMIFTLDVSRAAVVTVQIFDIHERLMGTLAERRQFSAGGHYLVWDGNDDYNQLVPTGSYVVEAGATGLLGNTTTSVEIYVDAQASIFSIPGGQRRASRREWAQDYVADDRPTRAGHDDDYRTDFGGGYQDDIFYAPPPESTQGAAMDPTRPVRRPRRPQRALPAPRRPRDRRSR
ncbi:MAG: hypothetical protein EXR62_17070 [Chloroflexi bacterium]|nr:hypothetical protein [Chloroflexota bacterium]